jgi:hypothetical protein
MMVHLQKNFYFFFLKFGPDVGPLGPKLVANSSKTIQCYIVVSDEVHVQFVVVLYFKHNGTSSTNIKLKQFFPVYAVKVRRGVEVQLY